MRRTCFLKKAFFLLFPLSLLFILCACGQGGGSLSAPGASTAALPTPTASAPPALAAYGEFLAGRIDAQDPKDAISSGIVKIKNITLEPALKTYCALFDMNGDGVPELHLRPIAGGGYAIFTYSNGQVVLWHCGPDYESPLNNGAILYEREGAAPTHTNYYYAVLNTNGDELSRVDFAKYHSVDGSGQHESAGYDVFTFENRAVSEDAWNSMTQEYLSIKSDLIIWNET